MKKFFLLTAFCLSTFPLTICAAQTADLRLYCLSLQFSRGSGVFDLYKLDFTGIQNGINGELYPLFEPTLPSHFTSLILRDESDEQIPGSMVLDVPETDLNGDGFADIFDASRSLSSTSSGMFSFPGQSGSVSATWTRNAGSVSGTCVLNFQSLGMFTHTFSILEYKGPLIYTAGTNLVSASVNLTSTASTTSQLLGPLNFIKSTSDPQNLLTLQAGTLTNENSQTLAFLSRAVVRDEISQTNYYGIFEFDDWNLNTAEADYYIWVVSIDDTNDSDNDMIPDFSDAPQLQPVPQPFLALQRTPTNFSLTITGSVGQMCEIQETPTLTSTNWPTVMTVTLTNTSQIVSLPLSPDQTKFWRVHVP